MTTVIGQKSDAKITVAVFEDEDIDKDGFRYRLQEHSDIDLVLVSDQPQEILDLVSQGGTDVVLLDLLIYGDPDLGLKVAKEIKKENPLQRCIVVSNTSTPVSVQEASRLHVEGFIEKNEPVDYDKSTHRIIKKPSLGLAEVIRTVARGGSYYSSYLTVEALSRVTLTSNSYEGLELSLRERRLMAVRNKYPEWGAAQIAFVLDRSLPTVKGAMSSMYKKAQLAGTGSFERFLEIYKQTPYIQDPIPPQYLERIDNIKQNGWSQDEDPF